MFDGLRKVQDVLGNVLDGLGKVSDGVEKVLDGVGKVSYDGRCWMVTEFFSSGGVGWCLEDIVRNLSDEVGNVSYGVRKVSEGIHCLLPNDFLNLLLDVKAWENLELGNIKCL